MPAQYFNEDGSEIMKKTTQSAVIIACLLAVIALFVLFLKDILIPYVRMEIANDVDGARDLLVSKGVLGFLTVILVEALQMVVVFIPAEFIQISSGMSYPFYLAIILCDLGVCLGATIIYILVRSFHFKNDAYTKREEVINRIAVRSKKDRGTVLLLYFLFIMPIIPFGAICYYGSSRKLKYGRYILTVATGVIPSIITSNLIGAATKLFIRNDLPIWLLILIIILLGAVLFTVLFIFIYKFWFKENEGTPDSVVYSVLFGLAKRVIGGKHKVTADAELIKDLEPPYIVLCNHESFYDFYYIRSLFGSVNPAYVANRHYLSYPLARKPARLAGFIPKKLFVPDMATPVGIMRAMRSGYPVVLFPEGRLSITGRSYPIVESSGAFLKRIGANIVIASIDGAYFANPKWRKKIYRANIRVKAEKVILGEETKQMTPDELEQLLADSLYHDASDDPAPIYRQKNKAKGLESILYRCCDCGALYTTKSVGSDLVCSSCGSVHTFDDSYRFTTEPRTIAEYYDRICELEKAELPELCLETDVNAVAYSEKGRFKTKLKGRCRLDREGFSFTSENVSFTVGYDSLPALPFSCDAEFETYHEDKLYYFYPVENRRQVVRWALIVDLIKETRNEEGKDRKADS